MSSIGSSLKDARGRQSLSLEEVHAKIKIHPRVLQLLEDDKFDKLPSPLFAKSFLRSYAEFLNIDAEEMLKAYEKVEKKDAPERSIFIRSAEEREAPPPLDKRWVVLGAAAAALGLAFLLVFSGKTLVERAQKNTKSPAAKIAPKTALKAAAKTAVAAAADDWLRSPSQGNFPSIARKTPLDLKIKALDNVWLRVTCDGKVLFQSILKRGAAQTWAAQENIEIWTGNSSNMVLALNGYNLGSPGKGVVKKLTISRSGVKIPS